MYISWAKKNCWDTANMNDSDANVWLLVAVWLNYTKQHPVKNKCVRKFLNAGSKYRVCQDMCVLTYYLWVKYPPNYKEHHDTR